MRSATRTGPALLRAALVTGLGLLASGSSADAGWLAFVPRPFENHAWIETYGSYEEDNSSGSARGVRWKDAFFRERLTVESLGYSYDPRFLQYKLSIAGAVKQEHYDSTAVDSRGWMVGEGIEYDARVYLLPEHRANAQLFASRHEPVYRQQAANSHDSVIENYGGTLRYQHKPWFFDGTFVDTTLDSSSTESNVKRLNLRGEYFKRFVNGYETSFDAAFNPSWYDDSRGLDGDSMEYLAGNLINVKHARLDSRVSQNNFSQDRSNSDNYETDQFSWWELMSIYLPWGFRNDLAFRHHDDESTIDDVGPQPERTYTDKGDNFQFDLVHRLYDSLDSRYRFVWDDRESNGGGSTLLSNSLNLEYTKEIPWGRFQSGLNFGRGDFDNSGFADVINDPYTATPVPGTFTLRQQNVDDTSIAVVMRSPLPPFDTISLVEGVHYTVNTALQPFEVEILTLPPEFAVPGSYDFYVTYSLLGGEYELRTDTAGTSISIQLFDQMVTPYFRFLAQRSDVLSGAYPGVPIDSDNYSTGVRFLYGPLRARTEYQYFDWDVNPYRAWRAEVQYVGTVTRTITAYATTSYLNRDYLGGEPPYFIRTYTEETYTTSGTVTKQLWSRNMVLSVGGAWSHVSGISDSDAWSANSTLTWHIGKLDLSLGISAYGSDSSAGNDFSAQRDHQLFFFNLRRQLL